MEDSIRRENLALIAKQLKRREDERSHCPHVKPNNSTALVGTRTGTGNMYLCQYCLKEWTEETVPPVLRPNFYLGGAVGGGMTTIRVAAVEQYLRLQKLTEEQKAAEEALMATTDAIYDELTHLEKIEGDEPDATGAEQHGV